MHQIFLGGFQVGNVCRDDHSLTVAWTGGGDAESSVDKFPFVWLRDNCQCSQCYHESSDQRAILMADLNVNTKPKSISVDQSRNKVPYKWVIRNDCV